MSSNTISYASVPVVTIGGSLDTVVMGDAISLEIEEDINGMCFLELQLVTQGPDGDHGEYSYLDRRKLDFGTTLSVRLGPENTDPLFDGRISAIGADFPDAGIATVTLKAEDALQDLRRTRRSRSFEQLSVADIVQQLASEHGLTAAVGTDGPARDVVTQVNLSDLAFLRLIAQAEGAEVWLAGTTLHLADRASRDAGSITLRYGSELTEFTVSADLAHQCSTLAVTGWSVDDKDLITASADASRLGGELGQDVSGADILKSAFSDRNEHLVVAEPLDAADAQLRAAAAYAERARRFVTGTARCSGNPVIRVGVKVTLNGLGSVFNGDYRVVRAAHCWNLVDGYTTEFDVERAGLGRVS